MRARTGARALRRARIQRANDRIFLYEICDSRAAFGTYLSSPHLATFNTTRADLVMNENVC